MHVKERAGKCCVILRNHGPVAAALFVAVRGKTVRKKLWIRGPRPSWVQRATRNAPTLLIDSSLATLADSSEDVARTREKLAQIGIEANSLVSSSLGCTVAIRAANVAQINDSARDSGLVTDFTTSLAALELATFLDETKTADAAKATFHEGSAFLSVREGGRVSVRRFVLPTMAPDLTLAIEQYAGPQIVLDGILEKDCFAANCPAGCTLRDMRIADKDAVCAGILSRAAEFYYAGDLALFEEKGQRVKNIARRWLPPLSAALGLLCLAAIAPLADARADARAEKEILARMTARKAEADARAEGNRRILARIEELSIKRNRMIDGMTRTERTLGCVEKIQDSKRAARRLELETVSIGDSGRTLTISGSLPADSGNELGAFMDKLVKARFRETSDIAMREKDGRISFSVNMEAKR
jgi:hypothetical protein